MLPHVGRGPARQHLLDADAALEAEPVAVSVFQRGGVHARRIELEQQRAELRPNWLVWRSNQADETPRSVEELVERAKAGLDGKPKLAILFATTQYDTESLVAGVCGLLGDVPLWGGSSSTGVFQDAGWITSDAGAASLMLIADRPAGVGVAAVGAGDGFAAGLQFGFLEFNDARKAGKRI